MRGAAAVRRVPVRAVAAAASSASSAAAHPPSAAAAAAVSAGRRRRAAAPVAASVAAATAAAAAAASASVAARRSASSSSSSSSSSKSRSGGGLEALLNESSSSTSSTATSSSPSSSSSSSSSSSGTFASLISTLEASTPSDGGRDDALSGSAGLGVVDSSFLPGGQHVAGVSSGSTGGLTGDHALDGAAGAAAGGAGGGDVTTGVPEGSLLPEVEEIVVPETEAQWVRREAEAADEAARMQRGVKAGDEVRHVRLLPHYLVDGQKGWAAAVEEGEEKMDAFRQDAGLALYRGEAEQEAALGMFPHLAEYPLRVRRWVVDAMSRKGIYNQEGEWLPTVTEPMEDLMGTLGLRNENTFEPPSEYEQGADYYHGLRTENYLPDDETARAQRREAAERLRIEYENLPAEFDGYYRFGLTQEEVEAADLPEKLVHALSFAAASEKEIKQFRIFKAVQKFQRGPGDTGSPEVQIAVLCIKIDYLTRHMQKNKKDKHNEKALRKHVSARKKMLAYLKRKNVERYYKCISALELDDMVRAKTMWWL